MDEQLTNVEREQAAREARTTVLQEELRALAGRDDAASLVRRYELHRTLIWHVWAMGTTRGQEQAEQAVVIARRLQDQRRLAEHGGHQDPDGVGQSVRGVAGARTQSLRRVPLAAEPPLIF